MAEYHITRKAVQDLTAIWEYTLNTWSESQADIYYHDLVNTFNEIASRPILFDREYAEIQNGLYGRKCNRHIVFYKIAEDDVVEIVRILHERMDIRRWL